MADLLLDTLTVKLRGDLSALGGDIGKMEGDFRKGFANIQNAAQRTSASTAQSFNIIGQGAATAIGQGTKQGTALFDQFGRQIKTTSETAKASIASIGTAATATSQNVAASLKSIAGGLGIAFSVSTLINFTQQLISTADHLSDLADNTDLSIGTLIGLKRITDQTGTSVDSFARGILMAQKNLGEIKNDADPAAKALKELGLSLEEMRGASSDEFLKKLIIALGGVTDQGKRLALQTAILGRGGLELNSTISKLAKEGLPQVSEQTAEAYRRLGAFADATARAASAVRDFFSILITQAPKGPLERLDQQLKDLEARRDRAVKERQGKGVPGIEALINQKVREREAIEGQLPQALTPPPFVTPIDPEKLKSLTEGLRNQITALQAESIALNQGEAAALRFKLTQEAMAVVGKNIPPEIQKQINSIVALSSAIAQLKVEEEALASAFEASELKIKASTDTLTTLRDTLRNIDLAGLSEGAKALADSDKQFDDLTVAITKAADALQALGELGPAKAKEIQDSLDKIGFLKGQATLKIAVGAGANISGTSGLDALDKGEGDDRQEAVQRTENFTKALAGLNIQMANVDALNLALGGGIDVVSQKIQLQTQKVEELVKQYGALSPQVQQAVDELKNLKGIDSMQKSFETVFDAITSGIDETLKGVLQGTQSFGDAMKNLARNVAFSIANELNKQFIIEPLKKGLASLLPTAPGATPGVAGLVPNIAAPQIKLPDDLAKLVEAAKVGFNNLTTSIGVGLEQMFQQSQSGFSGLFSSLGTLISDALSSLKNIGGGEGGGGLFKAIGSGISSAISWIGSFFEQGGQVRAITAASMGIKVPMLRFGAGGEVPAILHEGEYVLRKSAVDKIGIPALESMNRGLAIPHVSHSAFAVPQRYDNGGMVAAANMSSAGKMMMSAGRQQVTVNIKGGIVPERPGMTEKEVINIVTKDFDNDGQAAQTMRARMSNGRG